MLKLNYLMRKKKKENYRHKIYFISTTDSNFINSSPVHPHDYGAQAEQSMWYSLNSQCSTMFKDQLMGTLYHSK